MDMLYKATADFEVEIPICGYLAERKQGQAEKIRSDSIYMQRIYKS
jgi:hypothetical protein